MIRFKQIDVVEIGKMEEKSKLSIGAIEWQDLTVPDAERSRNFYCDVVGWDYSSVSMGEYDDFSVNLSGSGETVAGICHAGVTTVNCLPSGCCMSGLRMSRKVPNAAPQMGVKYWRVLDRWEAVSFVSFWTPMVLPWHSFQINSCQAVIRSYQ